MPLPGPIVSTEWLRTNIDQVVVVDVRWYLDGRSGRAAYDAGHIPGAVFADLDTDLSAPAGAGGRHPLPDPDAFATSMGRLGIDNETTVVAYDDAGAMVAGRLWWMLDALGVPAAVLDGGIQAWGDHHETASPDIRPRTFAAAPWPADRFATADEVDERGDDVVLIDARSAERYEGQENAIDPRFGHIPGARHAGFGDNLQADGTFRDQSAIGDRFADLGIDEDTEVIAYCGSGVSACNNLVAMRQAGLTRTRLYVGSWSEWGADDERPLQTGV